LRAFAFAREAAGGATGIAEKVVGSALMACQFWFLHYWFRFHFLLLRWFVFQFSEGGGEAAENEKGHACA
jgi:hypothetical protein